MIHLRNKFSSSISYQKEAVLSTCIKTPSNCLCLNINYSTFPSQHKEKVPYAEREGRWQSMFALFKNKENSPPDISRLNPKHFSLERFKEWINKKQLEKLRFEQRYIQDRHLTLGNDLASAHFLVFRGGAVKFVGHNWIKDKSTNKDYDDEIPNHFDPSLFVEALDYSKIPIIYEGLENVKGLTKLKWLSFKSCPHFDDWCLDRITGEYAHQLEYLDISETKVTYRGLGVLYRCRKLKTLRVFGISDSNLFKLTCLMLEDIIPNVNIEGVEYLNIEQMQ